MLRVIKALGVFVFLAGVGTTVAHADSIFTLNFDPLAYTVGPNGTAHLMVMVKNTGTTDLVNYDSDGFSNPPLPFLAVNTNFTSVENAITPLNPLQPGQSVNFALLDAVFTNAPAGFYLPVSNVTLTLLDASGAQITESAPFNPTVEVTSAVPEPGTAALLGSGLVCAMRTMRRRAQSAS